MIPVMTTISAAPLRIRFLRSSSSWRRMFVRNDRSIVIANTKSIWKPSSEKISAAAPSDSAQVFNSDPVLPSWVARNMSDVFFLFRRLIDPFRFFLKFLFRKSVAVIGIKQKCPQMKML